MKGSGEDCMRISIQATTIYFVGKDAYSRLETEGIFSKEKKRTVGFSKRFTPVIHIPKIDQTNGRVVIMQ